MANLYRLIDPRTAEVKYIGCTKRSTKARLIQHMAGLGPGRRPFSARAAWLVELKLLGMRPHIELIEEVPDELAAAAELAAIRRHRELGHTLVNGDYGSTFLPVDDVGRFGWPAPLIEEAARIGQLPVRLLGPQRLVQERDIRDYLSRPVLQLPLLLRAAKKRHPGRGRRSDERPGA